MNIWNEQGCEQCRHGVLSGMYSQSAAEQEGVELMPPTYLTTSIEAHAHLHHCSVCDSWWEFNEREAHVISENEAHSTFFEYFSNVS